MSVESSAGCLSWVAVVRMLPGLCPKQTDLRIKADEFSRQSSSSPHSLALFARRTISNDLSVMNGAKEEQGALGSAGSIYTSASVVVPEAASITLWRIKAHLSQAAAYVLSFLSARFTGARFDCSLEGAEKEEGTEKGPAGAFPGVLMVLSNAACSATLIPLS